MQFFFYPFSYFKLFSEKLNMGLFCPLIGLDIKCFYSLTSLVLLQGRLFLSARIIGFHANLFGHKTKFFFLWEDIDDIQLETPTLSSMGSPVIVMTLRPGRGMDARHGAKSQDAQGRLKFHFHSFVSFNVAQRY